MCCHELGQFSSLGLTGDLWTMLRMCSPYTGRGLGCTGLPARSSQAGAGRQWERPVPQPRVPAPRADNRSLSQGEHQGSELGKGGHGSG